MKTPESDLIEARRKASVLRRKLKALRLATLDLLDASRNDSDGCGCCAMTSTSQRPEFKVVRELVE